MILPKSGADSRDLGFDVVYSSFFLFSYASLYAHGHIHTYTDGRITLDSLALYINITFLVAVIEFILIIIGTPAYSTFLVIDRSLL